MTRVNDGEARQYHDCERKAGGDGRDDFSDFFLVVYFSFLRLLSPHTELFIYKKTHTRHWCMSLIQKRLQESDRAAGRRRDVDRVLTHIV